MNTSRFWLVHRVRDDLQLYGVLGTYYLLREDYSFFKTLYTMYVAHHMNKHRDVQERQRITPTLN